MILRVSWYCYILRANQGDCSTYVSWECLENYGGRPPRVLTAWGLLGLWEELCIHVDGCFRTKQSCPGHHLNVCEWSMKNWCKLLEETERRQSEGAREHGLRWERTGRCCIPCLRMLDEDRSWGTQGNSTCCLLNLCHVCLGDSSNSSCIVRCRNPQGRCRVFLLP